jgi:hypothetical protein
VFAASSDQNVVVNQLNVVPFSSTTLPIRSDSYRATCQPTGAPPPVKCPAQFSLPLRSVVRPNWSKLIVAFVQSPLNVAESVLEGQPLPEKTIRGVLEKGAASRETTTGEAAVTESRVLIRRASATIVFNVDRKWY